MPCPHYTTEHVSPCLLVCIGTVELWKALFKYLYRVVQFRRSAGGDREVAGRDHATEGDHHHHTDNTVVKQVLLVSSHSWSWLVG